MVLIALFCWWKMATLLGYAAFIQEACQITRITQSHLHHPRGSIDLSLIVDKSQLTLLPLPPKTYCVPFSELYVQAIWSVCLNSNPSAPSSSPISSLLVPLSPFRLPPLSFAFVHLIVIAKSKGS